MKLPERIPGSPWNNCLDQSLVITGGNEVVGLRGKEGYSG